MWNPHSVALSLSLSQITEINKNHCPAAGETLLYYYKDISCQLLTICTYNINGERGVSLSQIHSVPSRHNRRINMFYVYDIDGLRFRGPMETLENQRRVTRRSAIRPVTEEEEATPYPKGPEAQAVGVYQEMVKRENMVEPLVLIDQIMSSPVSTISPETSLVDAWWMLRKGNIRQLVVTSATRDVVGLLSDRDILQRINVVGDEVEVERDLTVAEVIPEETITTDANSDIRRVARVMAFFHRDAMPVIDQDRLIGIVTRGDILRGFAENPKLNLWA